MVYFKHEKILEDYKNNLEKYNKICNYASVFLKEKARKAQIFTFAVESRVKTEESLIGKLQRKGDKYTDIKDITDICGCRVICYFSDDVDKVAEIIEDNFEIDRTNSIDKRKLLEPTSFGYLSIHFICTMTEEKGFPKELCGIKFEIQVRSLLQHAWSVIDHDLSYKSQIGIPSNIIREFARIAGLLEIADEKFIEIRDHVNDYIAEVKKNVNEDKLDDTKLDIIYLYIYVSFNKEMLSFYNSISEQTDIHINRTNAENYIPQLNNLGIRTVKQLHEMLIENRELALKLATITLKHTGVEELPFDIGLRFLCYAKMLNENYTAERMAEFLDISLNDKKIAAAQANRIIAVKNKIVG